MTMHLTVLDHPLVDHKLTVLRDKNTPSNIFRELVSELVTLEAYEATHDLAVEDRPIETPVASATRRQGYYRHRHPCRPGRAGPP